MICTVAAADEFENIVPHLQTVFSIVRLAELQQEIRTGF
jgi:hypothetical protein